MATIIPFPQHKLHAYSDNDCSLCDGAVRSVDSNAPPLELRLVGGGNVLLNLNQIMSQQTALAILALVQKDQEVT